MDKKFKIVIIIAIVVIAVGSISGITFMFLTMQNKMAAMETGSQEAGQNYKRENLEIIAIKEAITTNIAEGEDKLPHLVKIAVAFAIDTQAKNYKDVKETLATNEIIIRDEIIRVLRQQTYEMMTRTGENNAQDKLSTEILTVVNDLLGTDTIKEVRFGDFFVQ